MRSPIEEVGKVGKRSQSLERFLRLYLEQRPNLKILRRKDLVRLIKDKLHVSAATAYDYANALKILVLEEENEGRKPLEDSWRTFFTSGARNELETIKIMLRMVDAPLILKMKEYGMNLWKDVVFGGVPFPCNRHIFSNELGLLIEKVGHVALLDPDFAHAAKDLAEACFIKSVEIINPHIEVRGLNPSQDAMRYVEWILAYKARKREKSKKSPRFLPQREQTAERRRVEVAYKWNKEDKSKYLKGLDMWFVLPGEPIADALIRYCYDKRMQWQDAVRNLLMNALKAEGFQVQ
ncbi:MAG: hypothetical protein ABSC91_06105 [Candidatus Bathyarchaeia archaeon]|jgi:hypothetical protein